MLKQKGRRVKKERTFGVKRRKKGLSNYGYEIYNNNSKGI